MKRILSGIQPTGPLHLGNYFGMMVPALELAAAHDAVYFIADYHALTTISDRDELRDNVVHAAVDFLAAGLDPAKTILFRQSDVPEVLELSWVLSTVTPMGLLERCHSYKDKTGKGLPASHGLFSYPVLMAADILIYDSDLVPVGQDQKQHVEVCRDVAAKINKGFGDGVLKVPESIIKEATAKVPGLDGQKMSKSYGNTLPLFGNQKKLRKLIMGIPTDSTPVEDPKPIKDSIILELYRLFATDVEYAAMVADFEKGGCGYGDLKQRLFDAYWNHFEPMRAKRDELLADPAAVEAVLADGAERARALAQPVLKRVRDAVGLGR